MVPLALDPGDKDPAWGQINPVIYDKTGDLDDGVGVDRGVSDGDSEISGVRAGRGGDDGGVTGDVSRGCSAVD